MSFIDGRAQCDECGSVIPSPFPAGVIVLMEVPNRPMRTPIKDWSLYLFCNLEESKTWLSDAEQNIEPTIVPFSFGMLTRRPRAAEGKGKP